MLFLQIRQAEVALAGGRLDEAYQLVQSGPIRSHRRGQALVGELVKKLVERAEAHLEGGRAPLALIDCEKAQWLGGNLDAAAALRSRIENEMVEADRARRNEARGGMLQNAVALVDSALGRKDLDRAVAELVRARGNGCTDHRLRDLHANVRTSLCSQIESTLNEGHLDEAQPLLDRLLRLDSGGLQTQPLARVMQQLRSAWTAIEAGDLRSAIEMLQKVRLPNAGWIKETIAHLAAASEAMDAVRIGPMGLIDMDDRPTRDPGFRPVPSTPLGPKAQVAGEALPQKFIVQVDGAGSYLVVRKPSVTVGPISSSPAPDIGLLAEPGSAPLTIERIEDDYFLKTPGSTGKLLSNGDRISISPRCRLVFTQPNPSSASAVLELTAGRFPRADMHRIILLDRDLIIGPGPSSHIRADLGEPVVLHIRDGQLWCRNQQVNVGSPLAINGLSLVVTV